jgi:6-methylsalicylate decarboxylase
MSNLYDAMGPFSQAPGHKDCAAQAGASRRIFLKSLAIAGAGALLPVGDSIGQAAKPAQQKTGRIDVHHHMVPPVWGAKDTWTPSTSLDPMDQNGVAIAMLSVTQAAVGSALNEPSEKGRMLARKNNEFGAQVVKDYPSRFGFFATIPLPDQDGSLREIEYSLDTLKADGIGLWNAYGEKWAGNPAFAAVFDELNRRKAVVFFHPIRSSCCNFPGQGSPVLDFDIETAQTISSMLLSGTFSRCPDIKFIFSHGGGAITVLYPRIIDGITKDLADKVPHGVEYELRRLYFDTAKANTPSILDALKDMVPVSQILYGSDVPVQKYALTNPGFAAYGGFSAADRTAIDRGNAERLFPRLATA